MFIKKAPALSGPDFIRGENWEPLQKTRSGWLQWAKRRAAKMQPLGFWHGVVAYVEERAAYRINFGGMPEKRGD
jgi:hypothetical protein